MNSPPPEKPPLPVVPEGVDVSVPNVARMYDYLLGGKDNTLIDRACADEVLRQVPPVREIAWANRRFLGRTVRFLAGERRIRQFIDIGAGLPGQENVHEIAQQADPESRVVYVDHDPIVLAHARALLARDSRTVILGAMPRVPSEPMKAPSRS